MSAVRRFVMLAIWVGLNACTTQAWYEGVKTGAEQNCRAQPESEKERCATRLNKESYDNYEKLRKAL